MNHQQEDDSQITWPVSAAIVTTPSALSTALLSINTAFTANITLTRPPISIELVHFQPLYLPAIWILLGEIVNNYKHD